MNKPTALDALTAKFGFPFKEQEHTIRKYTATKLAKELGFSSSRIRAVLRQHDVRFHTQKQKPDPETLKPEKRKFYLTHHPFNNKETSFNSILQKAWR